MDLGDCRRGLRAVAAAAATTATLGCAADETDSGRAPASTSAAESLASADPSLWYRRARALDLTGDGQEDSIRLDAVGTRPDSLRIALTLIVGGAVKHREGWSSSYEVALLDTSRRDRTQLVAAVRAKLDSVLSTVRVQRLDAPGVRLLAEDSAILSGLEPRPTHRVSFAYGYETTVRLVWDAPRQRFVRLWSCC